MMNRSCQPFRLRFSLAGENSYHKLACRMQNNNAMNNHPVIVKTKILWFTDGYPHSIIAFDHIICNVENGNLHL